MPENEDGLIILKYKYQLFTGMKVWSTLNNSGFKSIWSQWWVPFDFMTVDENRETAKTAASR